MKRNWYPKPSFPDVPFEEKTQMTQSTYDVTCIHKWNIDGLSGHLVINAINEMLMGARAYRLRGKFDHTIAQIVTSGFTGVLKDGLEKHIYDDEMQRILNHTTREKEVQISKEKLEYLKL